LDALELHKRRPALEHNDRVFRVHVFDANPSGLVLTEVGIETTDDVIQSLELPPSVIREVSDDLRFAGGALAGLTPDEAAELLRQLATPQQYARRRRRAHGASQRTSVRRRRQGE
jgi:CYTH domain-containing protein